MMAPLTAAIIVTHSADRSVVDRCVSSVLRAGIDEVVVVDNGDRSGWRFEDPHIKLVRTTNRGFGAAVNVGIRSTTAARYIVLNDDVTVAEDAVRLLSGALDQTGAAVAQPALIQAGSDPSTINSLGVHLGHDGAGTDLGRGGLTRDLDQSIRPLAIFTGGAFMTTRSFWEHTAGFSEWYVMYYEDVDLSCRGTALGYRYVLVPQAQVDHVGGLSVDSATPRIRFLQERNRLVIAVRFGTWRQVLGAYWLSIRRLRHPPRRVHAHALAAASAAAIPALLRRLIG